LEFDFSWELPVTRVPVLAAGGIVLRREQPPRIAVVRLRKRDEWVLPKGKLDEGETPRGAAKREVLEETGHNVTVHEFLGTLVYDTGGRSKVVHYWSMEASGDQMREPTSDIRAVDWLPLHAALERLSRGSERAFLETVGPLAVNGLSRRLRTKEPVTKESANKELAINAPAARKRRRRVVVTPEPALAEASMVELVPQSLQPERAPPTAVTEEPMGAASEALTAEPLAESEIVRPGVEADFCPAAELADVVVPAEVQRRSFAQKVREWFGAA
jgi:8-oxo-dGTP diphosphatase